MARRRTRKNLKTEVYALLGLTLMGILWSKRHPELRTWFLMAGITLMILFIGSATLKKYRRRKILANYKMIDAMSGQDFEAFVQAVYEKRGDKVTTTPTSNDYGADLIASNRMGKRVIQVKRYKGRVGIGAVQEVIGAIRHYQAQSAVVVTNSTFTAQAKNLAESNGVELIDREGVVAMLKEIHVIEGQSHDPLTASTSRCCPKCSGQLVQRTARATDQAFLGCSNYPSCRYSERLPG